MSSYCVMPTARWQICIPTNQLITLVRWFNEVLVGHCGIHRLCDSIATHFLHPQLRATVNDVIKHCRACQIKKLTGPGYGHLPPRKATALPFQEVDVDLIGPWHVTVPNKVYELYALTYIDLAMNFSKAICMRNKQTMLACSSTRACGVYTEAATYYQNVLILLRIEDELYLHIMLR
jgi:hypothetical protein